MKYGFTWKGHWNQKNETKSIFSVHKYENHAWENRLSWLLPLKGVNSLCFIIVDFSLQLLWPRQSWKQYGGPYSDRPDILRLACSFGLQILQGRFCRPHSPSIPKWKLLMVNLDFRFTKDNVRGHIEPQLRGASFHIWRPVCNVCLG